ncbi:MAG: hypothetical protein MZV70_04840 [Desulfobacterales bacterium]|nr:hypothetical protein [Desulfobacterales bacterium]
MTKSPASPFDFDTPIDRRGTDSSKWGKYAGPRRAADVGGGHGLRARRPAVIDALHRRVDHGVFGYTRSAADARRGRRGRCPGTRPRLGASSRSGSSGCRAW